MLRSFARVVLSLVLLASPVVLLAACGDDDGLPAAGVRCADLDPRPAVVTDIDETLTIADEEFAMQALDETYVPEARDGGVALMQGYYERGYLVLYLTARSETLVLLDGRTARQATEDWLRDLGYPMDPDRTEVVLAPEPVSGDETVAYKRDALLDRIADGWGFAFAFGNATTDASAYLEAGIPASAIFMIGEYAGYAGTVAVAGEDWLGIVAAELEPRGRVCDL